MVTCITFTCISWMNWMLNNLPLLNQNKQVQQIQLVSLKIIYIDTKVKWKHSNVTIILYEWQGRGTTGTHSLANSHTGKNGYIVINTHFIWF